MKSAANWTPLGTAREALVTRLREESRDLPPWRTRLPAFPHDLAAAMDAHEGGRELLLLAWELARCGPEADRRAVTVLVLASLVNQQAGSTRMPLEPTALEALLTRVGATEGDRREVASLVGRLRDAADPIRALVGGPGENRPLIVEGEWLYHGRFWAFEESVVQRLARQMASALEVLEAERVRSALADVLARSPMRLSPEQQWAVLSALHSPLAVITGGPGTGKTSIVVSILRVLVRLGVGPEQIALAAPTGKAANRMAESIRRTLTAIDGRSPEDEQLLTALPEPRTLHRLLGYSPGTDRFRHHERNPLAERVVLVDEGSMVDLFLMDRLVRSVGPQSRLVLLGDAEQLPSVDAGAVFRDLLPPAESVRSMPWHTLAAVDDRFPLAPAWEAGDDARARISVRLTHSFRMDASQTEGRHILSTARAINRGEPAALFDAPEGEAITLRSKAEEVTFSGAELLTASPGTAAFDAFWRRWFETRVTGHPSFESLVRRTYRHGDEGFPEEDARALATIFAHAEGSKVLCLPRGEHGGAGAGGLNAFFHRELLSWWRDRGEVFAHAPNLVPGDPVMVVRNDYERMLFNGDQGLVLRVSEAGGPMQWRVVFRSAEGGFRTFPLDSLREVDLAYAMTVHKSQGSEFDHVALCLPQVDLPLLTREILYTAFTRSRRSVTVVGARELLELGTRRTLERFSGIGERLARAGEG